MNSVPSSAYDRTVILTLVMLRPYILPINTLVAKHDNSRLLFVLFADQSTVVGK